MKIVFSLIFIFCLLACNPDKKRLPDADSPKFETKDPTRLFFKNVRQLYYNLEEKNEGKIQVFSMGDRPDDGLRPRLFVNLINNWHQDKAYCMVSPGKFYDSMEDPITIIIANKSAFSDTIAFERQSSMIDHYAFNLAIYKGIIQKNEMTFLAMNQTFPLFENNEERENFRKTMMDFYRLVGVF